MSTSTATIPLIERSERARRVAEAIHSGEMEGVSALIGTVKRTVYLGLNSGSSD